MATITSIVGGSAASPLSHSNSSTWVGGVVPSSGDTIIIPAGSYVSWSGGPSNNGRYVQGWLRVTDNEFYGFAIVSNGGEMVAENMNWAALCLITEGGSVTFTSTASTGGGGTMIVGAGGVLEFVANWTWYHGSRAVVHSGGVLVTGENFSYTRGFPMIAHSGASITIAAHSGNPIEILTYQGAQVTGAGAYNAEPLTGVMSTDLPAIADVRIATVYAGGQLSGSVTIPAASSVAAGVVYDNGTTGTAVLTQANVQAALTVQGYTTGRADNLDKLDATVSSRNATTPPTTAAIAGAILADPGNKIATDDQGRVTTANPATVGGGVSIGGGEAVVIR